MAPNNKIRLTATISSKLIVEIKNIHLDEIKSATERDRVEPDWSNTIEMLLRKGVKAYKSKATS
jgi:hypothetical protein